MRGCHSLLYRAGFGQDSSRILPHGAFPRNPHLNVRASLNGSGLVRHSRGECFDWRQQDLLGLGQLTLCNTSVSLSGTVTYSALVIRAFLSPGTGELLPSAGDSDDAVRRQRERAARRGIERAALLPSLVG